VGVCKDGVSAVQLISETKPDVALLDIFMPGLDGIKVVGRLRTSDTQTKIIMLTGIEGQDYVNVALKAGANGFVVKRRMHSDLHKAIETVLSGAVFVSPARKV
jgi:two-component system, NarL family, response regulator NreC